MRCLRLLKLRSCPGCRQAWTAREISPCRSVLDNRSGEHGSRLSTARLLITCLLSGRVGFYDACNAGNLSATLPPHNWRPYGIRPRKYLQAAQAPVGGIVEVPLAQTGEGIADCELLRWFVKEGDEVEEFQPLCEVQSDKASVEITSRYKGRVTRVLFVPGDVVKVGETLVEVLLDGVAASTSSVEAADEDQARSDSLSSSDDEGDLPDVSAAQANKKLLCTPAVRHLALEYGVNLADVAGTGTDGRILKEDLMTYVAAKEGLQDDLQAVSEPHLQPVHMDISLGDSLAEETGDQRKGVPSVKESTHGRDVIIPIRGFRRAMAKAMADTTSVPHFYYVEEMEVDSLIKLKQSLKGISLGPGVKLTYLPFMIKALSSALHKYPVMNSTVNSNLTEITCKGQHNVGVAMATESGLVVPNVKNVQQLSVAEIAKELSRLSQLASSNKLSSDDISGGTISMSNIGVIGGKTGSPLLNLPEVAIVAFGRIQKLPRFGPDGSVIAASILTATWAADHRVIDGATLASFCNEWKKLLEQPEQLLLQLR